MPTGTVICDAQVCGLSSVLEMSQETNWASNATVVSTHTYECTPRGKLQHVHALDMGCDERLSIFCYKYHREP